MSALLGIDIHLRDDSQSAAASIRVKRELDSKKIN
jgi:hypothetical protein